MGRESLFLSLLSLQGRSSLTNAEFEEIVQIVLQKSLQEYEGLACQESRGALGRSWTVVEQVRGLLSSGISLSKRVLGGETSKLTGL